MTEALPENPLSDLQNQMKLVFEQVESYAGTVLMPGSIKAAMRAVNDGVTEVPSRDLWQVDPHKLHVIQGLNTRIPTKSYLKHVRATVESMKLEGFMQDKPLAGYVAEVNGENLIFIYEGETRLKCALIAIAEGAPFDAVPVSVSQKRIDAGRNKPRTMTMAEIIIAKMRGNDGRPYTVFEQALNIHRLETQEKMSRAEIAHRLQLSVMQVGNLLRLMTADAEIRYLVATETISATLAIDLVTQFGANAMRHLRPAMEAAARENRTHITANDIPANRFANAVKRSAPQMYTALGDVTKDPNYEQLSLETREGLAGLLRELDELKRSIPADAPDAETADDASDQTSVA